MKYLIVIAAVCIATVKAGLLAPYGAPTVVAPALLNTGVSSQYRSQDNLGNYAFGYNEDHSTGGTFRREAGSPGAVTGSYGLRDIDGRVRVVNYVADALGYRANIQTNEPGVEPKDPASTLINKGVVAAVAPIVAAAPTIAHPAYAGYGAHYAAAPALATPYAPFGGLLIRK